MRELYASPNGDRWFLARDPVDGHAFVVHEANLPSGGRHSQLEIGVFLKDGGHSPEHHALLSLIGSLVTSGERGKDDDAPLAAGSS
jgi:hypothetical protein